MKYLINFHKLTVDQKRKNGEGGILKSVLFEINNKLKKDLKINLDVHSQDYLSEDIYKKGTNLNLLDLFLKIKRR